jgi:hypothetical protein
MDSPQASPPESSQAQLEEPKITNEPLYFRGGFPEETEVFQYTNLLSVRKRMNDRRNALERKQSSDQYLVFTDTPKGTFDKLSSDSSPTTHWSRLLYNQKDATLIIKIMLGLFHEFVAALFQRPIEHQIMQMSLHDQVHLLGAARVQFGDFIKEPDVSWAPEILFPNPICVLEIGLSESAPRLAIDARGWLESPSSTVKLAIIIKVNRTTPKIIFNRWELVTRQDPPRTRFSYPTASCVQTARASYLNGSTTVTGGFILPFEKLVGRPANQNNPIEQDFIFTQQDLQTLSEKVWKLQGLLRE